MKKLIIPLVALAILYSCEKSSEVDVIAEEGLVGVSLRLDKGFAVSSSDSNVDSSWPHIFQDLVDITFSSTTSSYSKTVSFNPNDVSSFPNTSLPYDTYNWSIANTGGSVTVSSALYIYGSSSSAFTVSSASTTIPLTLSTDFALVTVSETNLSSVSISQGGTDTSLTTNNGFYYGYINSVFSDYTVTFTSVENQSASDTITSPSASTHYNYTISYEGGTSVTVALSDTFQLEERDVTIGDALTQNLIAYYPFNSDANDESGNGNNGTVNGATLSLDRFGNENAAYNFNGTDNEIIIENAFYNNGFLNSTINIWFTSSDNSKSNQTILNTNPHNGESFSFNHGNSGYFSHFKNSDTSVVSWDIFSNNDFSSQLIENDIWYMLTIIKENNAYKYYLNGAFIKESNISIETQSQFTGISLGNVSQNVSNNEHHKGKLDDIAIWDRALTEIEIVELYNETDSDLTN